MLNGRSWRGNERREHVRLRWYLLSVLWHGNALGTEEKKSAVHLLTKAGTWSLLSIAVPECYLHHYKSFLSVLRIASLCQSLFSGISVFEFVMLAKKSKQRIN